MCLALGEEGEGSAQAVAVAALGVKRRMPVVVREVVPLKRNDLGRDGMCFGAGKCKSTFIRAAALCM